jgi:uncharacterized membrane protein YeaQ/YmgE (transglycosylase-associated protein family)
LENNNIMGLVAAFIGVAIIIAIGAQILGNSVSDCSTLPGYHSTNSTMANATLGTPGPLDTSTDWALQCEDINTSTQSAFALLIIVLIVIAAVIILSVVKML